MGSIPKRALAVLGRWDVVPLGMFVVLLVLIALELSVWWAVAAALSTLAFDITLHRPEWLRPGVYVLALVGFFVGYFATGDATAADDFYSATAQIVPVLFLALAIQLRQALGDRSRPSELRRAAGITALALVFAEYESLNALATGDPEDAAFRGVVGALVAAAVGLTLPVLLGESEEDDG